MGLWETLVAQTGERDEMLDSAWLLGSISCPYRSTRRGRASMRLVSPFVAQGGRFRSVKTGRHSAVKPPQEESFRWETSLVPVRRERSSGAKVMIPPGSVTRPKFGQGTRLEEVAELFGQLERWVEESWGDLESRHRVVVASSLAFVLCNMDKVNMSVAIIPMARHFGWGASVSGLVQSGFFWGYIVSQLPGGYLCSKFNGRKVLPVGVGLWALATASVPALAATIPSLCLGRAAVGLGEAVAPSAITDMVARSVPKNERSRAISFIFAGLHVGSIAGLLLAPFLIEHFGWPSVFLFSGASAATWVVWWERLVVDLEERDPAIYNLINQAYGGRSDAENVLSAEQASQNEVPWRAILRSQAVRALMFTHFCNNWFQYTFLAWLPSYFADTLHLDLAQAAQLSLLPPIAGIVTSSAAGPLADSLVARGWKTAIVRKVAQCTAFLGPAACLAAASFSTDSTVTVGLVTSALGLASFAMAGLYCNHQDLSPKYASFLLGLTNTTGAIPGIVGVFITGCLLDRTGSWPIALFAPSIVLFIAGSIVFTRYGRSELEVFDNDQPFEFEKDLKRFLPQRYQ